MNRLAREDHALLELGQALRLQQYQFVTPTPMTHSRVNSRPQHRVAHDLRGVFGWSRPFDQGLLPAPLFELMRHADILRAKDECWRSSLRLSSLDGLLLWHSAFPTDGDSAVFFGPDTYRFATAVTEHLARRRTPPRRAVDIGCGSGAGALLVARAAPEAEVLAIDINDEALRLTRINAALAGLDNVEARHSDLLTATEGEFDLIVANPPYLVDGDRRTYRHGGGPLGAELSQAIVEAALPRLAPGGSLLLYTGVAIPDGSDPFLRAIEPQLQGRGLLWHYRELDPDVFGEELLLPPYDACERIAAVVLEVTRPA